MRQVNHAQVLVLMQLQLLLMESLATHFAPQLTDGEDVTHSVIINFFLSFDQAGEGIIYSVVIDFFTHCHVERYFYSYIIAGCDYLSQSLEM